MIHGWDDWEGPFPWAEDEEWDRDALGIQGNISAGLWVTAKGRKLNLRTMYTAHIKNCITFLGKSQKKPYAQRLLPDMYDWIPVLKAELERRNAKKAKNYHKIYRPKILFTREPGMRITEIYYEEKEPTVQYGNKTVGVSVCLEHERDEIGDEAVKDAIKMAKMVVHREMGKLPSDDDIHDAEDTLRRAGHLAPPHRDEETPF